MHMSLDEQIQTHCYGKLTYNYIGTLINLFYVVRV